jgi:hypothetical protein
LKTLTNSKKISESRIKFPFRLSLDLIGQFFPVYIHSRLSEQFSGSHSGFGTTFRNTGSYQKAGTSALKRVTLLEGKASRNFYLDFLHKKTTKNCETIAAVKISRTLKKYSSRNTVPLINRKKQNNQKWWERKNENLKLFCFICICTLLFDVKIVEKKF